MAASKATDTTKSPEHHICPLCEERLDGSAGSHIRQTHGEEALHKAVLTSKEHGMPDVEIGARYGISYQKLEQIITEAYGANISVLKRSKRIKRWKPRRFHEETTSVWSFKQRGAWATHDGRYRGNWSPYIPRNVILKYSKPGDVVLDYFSGGGTTAVEAKLLGRRCITRDINPGAVGITMENLNFSPPRQLFDEGASIMYEPEVSVGDARDLSDIPNKSVDLICAHPPYAGIIKYSANIAGDLSVLAVDDFLDEMGEVARENLRVLKPGGKCAILIGDARKSKHVVPIGFQTIRVFLDAGFILRELVIKRQHNCKTTGFWYTRSIQYNFLLLAHEYLPVFEKPEADRVSEQDAVVIHAGAAPARTRIVPNHAPGQSVTGGRPETASRGLAASKARTAIFRTASHAGAARPTEDENSIKTTTVWLFPAQQLETELRRNLLRRFGTPDDEFVEIAIDGDSEVPHAGARASESRSRLPKSRRLRKSVFGTDQQIEETSGASLIYIAPPNGLGDDEAIAGYCSAVGRLAKQAGCMLRDNGYLVIDTSDVRVDGSLRPVGLMVWESLLDQTKFAIKEIVVVVPEEPPGSDAGERLEIIHRYLLICRTRE